MTVQFPQIQPQTSEAGLFGDSRMQNYSEPSFQQYLEEEQKRLAFMFSAFNQFNFNSWFAYPDFSLETEASAPRANLFGDIDLTPKEAAASKTQYSQPNIQNQPPASSQLLSQITSQQISNPTQILLQNLLMKTGWLTPNLEASSLFYQAQLQGKLLSKLDLQFLVDQILSQVKVVKEKGKVELMLGLKPENLGEILLTLTSRSGMISIQIQAPEETRKLIEAELRELELALKKAKVNLAEIKVLSPEEVGQNV